MYTVLLFHTMLVYTVLVYTVLLYHTMLVYTVLVYTVLMDPMLLVKKIVELDAHRLQDEYLKTGRIR